MLVLLNSGRRLEIETNHSVFSPLAATEGQHVDPETAPLYCRKAGPYLRTGVSIIVDNVVEVVKRVVRLPPGRRASWDEIQKVDLNEEPALF